LNRANRAGGVAAVATLAVITAAPAIARAASWSLIGGGDQFVPVMAPLGGGKLLACTSTRCDTYDVATSTWTEAGTGIASSHSNALARLRDGSLFLYEASGATATPHLRSAGAEAWRDAAPLPNVVATPQVQVMSDGRVILAGDTNTGRRAYVADPQAAAWLPLADPPPEAMSGKLLVARSGLFATVTARERTRLWRWDTAPDRWTEIPLPGWQGGTALRAVAWNDDVLLVATRNGRRESLLVAADGATRPTAKMPDGRDIGIRVLAAPPGQDAPLELRVDSKQYLWRSPDHAPLELPPDPLGWSELAAAIDAEHFIALGPQRALRLFSLDERAPPGAPCDGLERYLAVVSDGTVFGSARTVSRNDVREALALVTPACRAEVRQGGAAALRARLRAWSAAPKAAPRELGRTFTCAFAEGIPPTDISDWMTSQDLPLARATCLTQLPRWPGGEAAFATALQSAVRKAPDGAWAVDPALLAAAQETDAQALRRRLGPTLLEAQARRARGFDTLHVAACAKDAAPSPSELRTACAAAARAAKEGSMMENDRSGGVAAVVAATVIVAGTVAAAHVGRDEGFGRGIATAAGVVGGMTAGVGLGGLIAIGGGASKNEGETIAALIVGGALAGGILGGVAAYYLAEAPEARLPVTAAGLALPYILTIAIAFR
jgi:hypothetical protein